MFVCFGFASFAGAATKPEKLILFVYEDPENELMKPGIEQFERDYGIKVKMVAVPSQDYERVAMTKFAAQEPMDVVRMRDDRLAPWVNANFILPITNMPGFEDYKDELLPMAWEHINYKGEAWGLPCFLTFRSSWYYPKKLKEVGYENPPETWDEFLEIGLKAKKNNISEYPAIWVAGIGTNHGQFTWYTQTFTRGGKIFDSQMNPLFGENSIARRTLEWWQKTFLDWEISDPRSLEYRNYPAVKAFGLGKSIFCMAPEELTRFLAYQWDLPIAEEMTYFLWPGNHKTLGFVRLYTISATTSSKEYAWRLVEYLGGKTKQGEFLTPRTTMIAGFEKGIGMLLPVPYKPIISDPKVMEIWSKYFPWDIFAEGLKGVNHASKALPAFYEPWYAEWNDLAMTQVQEVLGGRTTADKACEILTEKVKELKARY